VQIQQLESPALLPTLDALDAEFACGNEQSATGRRRLGGTPMDSTCRPTQSEFPIHLKAAAPMVDPMTRSSPEAVIERPSLGRRSSRRLARMLIVFCIGVSTTLAWQSYGEAARAMMASLSPQLGWLAPQTTSVVPPAPDVVAPANAPSPDLHRLALGLAGVSQTVDQLTVQLAEGQRQMGGDIAKLQADVQQILRKLAAGPPRPTAAPAQKPSVTPPPSPSAQAR
jgi:hypothetical protein